MELLMPLLVKMSCSFRYVVAMHDVKDFISHTLTISCTFTDERESKSYEVGAA